MRKLFLIFLFLPGLHKAICQPIDTSLFEKFKSKAPLLYKDGKGNDLGCPYAYECGGMRLVFYGIEIDKSKRIVRLRGRAIDPRDSSGVSPVSILSGTAAWNVIKKPNLLGSTYIRTPSDKHGNNYPYRNGDFRVEAKIRDQDKLYFAYPLFWLIEYDVKKLFD